MSFFRKIFARRSPERVYVRAYELFLEGLSVDEVTDRLGREEFLERNVARAVVFLPSAFARVHYEK